MTRFQEKYPVCVFSIPMGSQKTALTWDVQAEFKPSLSSVRPLVFLEGWEEKRKKVPNEVSSWQISFNACLCLQHSLHEENAAKIFLS